MTLPGQMELATVIKHERATMCSMCDDRGAIGGFINADSGYEVVSCPDCNHEPFAWIADYSKCGGEMILISKEEALMDCDPMRTVTPVYDRQQYTHKPLGVRLAKMLYQYDDSPSSQLWSDIQRLALEILK